MITGHLPAATALMAALAMLHDHALPQVCYEEGR